MIEIEHNVPLPKLKKKKGYPFDKLDILDSFFVPNEKMSSMAGLAVYYGKKFGYRFTCLSTKYNGVPGIRVWRIEIDENVQ